MRPTPLGEGKTISTVGLGHGPIRDSRQAGHSGRHTPGLHGPGLRDQGRRGRRRLRPGGPVRVAQAPPHRRPARRHLRPTTCSRQFSTTTSTEGNELGLDIHSITWRRVLDINERVLRNMVLGLGSGRMDGIPHETGFDITAASEVMAMLALTNLAAATCTSDWEGWWLATQESGEPVTAEELHAAGFEMAVLMREAIKPESAPDPGEHSGPGPRRAVRQHRARQLLGHCRPHRHPRR